MESLLDTEAIQSATFQYIYEVSFVKLILKCSRSLENRLCACFLAGRLTVGSPGAQKAAIVKSHAANSPFRHSAFSMAAFKFGKYYQPE